MNFSQVNMDSVASIILGGGEGTRLHPLTLTRSKPAINFGGKYRLIDVPLSQSIHAKCHKTLVLTQYFSSSLHHHIFQTYMQGGPSAGLVEILTAEQKPSHKNWFQGTADAVRQNLDYLLELPVDYFLILSGDQLYTLNFERMLQCALETNAEVVIAALPVSEEEAKRLGILKINEEGLITEFHEKPQENEQLKQLKTPAKLMERLGFDSQNDRPYFGSMGIYLFKRKILADLLKNDVREDFGKHLIPSLVQKGKTAAFIYEGYWEDIGTIETFYHANMALTNPYPVFQLFDEKKPLFTPRWDLPPAKVLSSKVDQALLSEGILLDETEIFRSIIGPRTKIQKGTTISDSYLMGNDYYKRSLNDYAQLPEEPSIGENCIIEKAIIDKNVLIGKNVHLKNHQKLLHYDGESVFIREGVIVVPRGARIPDGFTI